MPAARETGIARVQEREVIAKRKDRRSRRPAAIDEFARISVRRLVGQYIGRDQAGFRKVLVKLQRRLKRVHIHGHDAAIIRHAAGGEILQVEGLAQAVCARGRKTEVGAAGQQILNSQLRPAVGQGARIHREQQIKEIRQAVERDVIFERNLAEFQPIAEIVNQRRREQRFQRLKVLARLRLRKIPAADQCDIGQGAGRDIFAGADRGDDAARRADILDAIIDSDAIILGKIGGVFAEKLKRPRPIRPKSAAPATIPSKPVCRPQRRRAHPPGPIIPGRKRRKSGQSSTGGA